MSFRMLWCMVFVVFSPIVSAFVPGLGYNPVVGGGLYPGAGAVPVYPGYVGKPMVYGQHMADGSNYYGGAGGYKNFMNDDVGRESLKDSNYLINKGARGVVGGQSLVSGNQGNQGYYKDNIGTHYNQQGKGAAGGAQRYGQSGEDGYGGYGNAGHKKGHRTSGFHKSYHNVESGKDTKFLDEDHNVGEEKFGQAFDSNYDDKAWDAHGHGQGGGLHAEKVAGGAAARGAMSAGAAHDVGYDALHHNGYYNDRDLAYRSGQALAQKGGAGGYGQHGMRGGMGGGMYHNSMW